MTKFVEKLKSVVKSPTAERLAMLAVGAVLQSYGAPVAVKTGVLALIDLIFGP